MSQAEAFSSDLEKQLSKWLGAIPLLIPIFQRLNVVEIINRYTPCEADVDSGTVALILALNRLMAHRPLYKVADWMAETVLQETLGIAHEKLHDRRIGDLLDAISPHLDSIWKEIVSKAVSEFGINIDFIHYDITSIYFEGVYSEADLLEYGYSRDNKPHCKQVNLRLNVTSDDGIPLAFKVISGSTADRTTPIENMRSLRQVLEGLPNSDQLVIVSDQAMLSASVIVTYQKLGIGYLGPLATIKAYEEVLMSCSTEELLTHPLDYHPQNQKADEPSRYYGLLTEVTIFDEKTKKSVSAQALLLYSRNKAKLDLSKRETLLNRYLTRLKQIKEYLNQRKYKKAGYTEAQIKKAQNTYRSVAALVDVQLSGSDGQLTLCFEINQKKLAQAKERDGRYLLVTNRPLSALEMLTRFKQQDKVEKRNRTIKGPIRIRPIFLHKQERIESLIFICMLALLVFSILEMEAKRRGIVMTGTALIEQFATLSAVYSFFNDGSCYRQLVPLTEFQQQFLLTLQLPEPEIYLQPIKRE